MNKADALRRRDGAHILESIGLGVPVPEDGTTPARPPEWEGVTRVRDLVRIAVGRLVPDPDQPRQEFDAEGLRSLAASITDRGVLQPIRVRWSEGDGRYVIVAGERRWRAACLAGQVDVPCILATGPASPDEVLMDQLIENCLRQDLRPLEQARAFRTLLDRKGWTTRQLAEALHLSHSSIVKATSLLDLPAPVRDRVEDGTLSPASAYEVAKSEDPEALAARAVAEKMTRDEVRAAVAAPRARPRRVTFRCAGGTVAVTLAGDADVSEVLRAALDQASA